MKDRIERIIQACLLLVGLIHLVPLIGVVGNAHLSRLYGIPIDGPELSILMRHRAVLFGVLGVLMVAGAVRPSLRKTALLAGSASVASFLVLAWLTGGYNREVGGVVAADAVAMALLVVACILQASRHAEAK